MDMFTIFAALAILVATAVVGGVCIMMLRDPPGTDADTVSDRGEPIRRVVRGKCGKVSEFYASDVAPSGTTDRRGAARPFVRTHGDGPAPMFPGLITLRRLLAHGLAVLRPVAARAGLPVAATRRSVQGELVSLAGTVVEPWEDAVNRLGIEYPLADRGLVHRAVETVQTAWGRMAGDEPRMTPMAQRIAITGLLSDDTCRKALAAPRQMTEEWLVDRAQMLLARQVLTPPSGRRAGTG
ncbi:hypothetical protein [Fodinicurvata sp. EGI_FJ10296]|uniref:hypothetical protein n=1 Tax=Fodinicurvata sp. EGI_FJ10296 TaxID=3231908 RepID=UPI00345556CA